MGMTTSAKWKEIFRMRHTHHEFKFEINGVTYTDKDEISHSVDSGLFEEMAIGQAACAQLTLETYASDIPRGATIKRYVRLVNGDNISEWLPAGIFFVNTRSFEDGIYKLEAFDVMRKAEQPWNPEPSLNFPMPMDEAAKELARIMGTTLDPRTSVSHNYMVEYPTTDPDSKSGDQYSIRKILQFIAAAMGGNWIVTQEGKLLLLPLGSEPEETNFLICEHGDPINFGGKVILV